MPASRNETASEAPSRPTLITSPATERDTAPLSARTNGFVRDTIAGTRVNVRTTSTSSIAPTWARISSGSWPGRKRTSTSTTHVSGTLLSASPPMIRPRLMEGRSNSSDDSRVNGSVSILRKTSIALSTALSPSHGVDPWAERPVTCSRMASTPLASTPMCRSVGSPVMAKSAA
jgi:hypothetical protein